MAAQCEPLSGYLPQALSDPGSNSERSADSPLPGSEEDAAGPRPLRSPEWGEERFRVDRKKLEAMLQARPIPDVDELCFPKMSGLAGVARDSFMKPRIAFI